MQGFLGISWVVWGVVALLIAALFAVFVPYGDKVAVATGIRHFILRWFHSLLWVALAASFFLRASGNPTLQGIADPVAALGGIMYAAFMFTLVSTQA